MDVVCLSGLHGQLDALPAVIAEIYRVLRPGGKVLSILPAWYNVLRWQELCHPWMSWFRPSSRKKPKEPRYSSRDLREMFQDFSEHRLYQRHLRRSDLPHLWRWLPLPLLERLMGKFVLLKAFKPLSSAHHRRCRMTHSSIFVATCNLYHWRSKSRLFGYSIVDPEPKFCSNL